ncbi:MAG TPA: hypothetical protein VLV78_14240 [Thermoanaerobaculia bacterium]|nr:hypothetical protein [Thermoanaerobaculia bacterium]
MKSVVSSWLLLASASVVLAAPPLFKAATESKWILATGTKSLGTVTLLTSSSGTRAEVRATSGPVTTYLGGNGNVWVRASGGDVELSTISATTPQSTAAAALLLPFTTTTNDVVETKDGKVTSYRFRGAKATYTYDARGPSKVDLESGGARFTLTRTSASNSTADASNFAIRPKKSAGSRLARLSGDLLGPSDTNVSATAGGRGAGTKGLKLKDGGDYAAVEKLEQRDANWKAKLDSALDDFQKSGKVGKARENQ